jgi:hypothetical protein
MSRGPTLKDRLTESDASSIPITFSGSVNALVYGNLREI